MCYIILSIYEKRTKSSNYKLVYTSGDRKTHEIVKPQISLHFSKPQIAEIAKFKRYDIPRPLPCRKFRADFESGLETPDMFYIFAYLLNIPLLYPLGHVFVYMG